MPVKAIGISQTLLEKLFLRPRPIDSRAYAASLHHLFPGIRDFQNFLQARATEEQTSIAKRILTRLIHYQRLSPPTALLYNLLDFEVAETAEPKRPKGYIARDHFNHLVQLYLLGIYLFSHHRGLHSRCARYLHQLKRRFAADLQRKDKSAAIPDNVYMIFGTAWCLFVLYHDLGYPLERITPKRRDPGKKDSQARFLLPFSNVAKLTIEDMVLKAISNLVVAYTASEQSIDETLADQFLEHSSDLYLHPECLDARIDDSPLVVEKPDFRLSLPSMEALKQVWNSASHLPNFYGSRSRAFLSLFPDEHICAVLENQGTGRPVVAIFSKNPYSQFACFFDIRSERPQGVRNVPLKSLADSAFVSRRPMGENLDWRFFGLDVRGYFKQTINATFPRSAGSLQIVADRFRISEDSDAESILSWGQGREASFLAFLDLRERFAPFEVLTPKIQRDELEERFAAVRISVSSALRDLPHLLGEVVEAEAAERAKKLTRNGRLEVLEDFMSNPIRNAMQKFVNDVLKRAEPIGSQLTTRLEPRVREEVRYLRALREVRDEAEELIIEFLGNDFLKNVGGFAGQTIDVKFSLIKLLDKTDSHFAEISSRLEKLGLPGLAKLIGEYVPDYIRDPDSGYSPETFIDHGLAAGLLGVTLDNLYSAPLRALETQNEAEEADKRYGKFTEASGGVILLRLALLLDWAPAVRGLMFEEKTFQDVIFSSLIHNLYPKYLPGEGKLTRYKTGADPNPFVYLCLLADGLQEWDRSRQLNQAWGDLPGASYGDRFDLAIKDEQIVVSIWGRGVQIQKDRDSLRDRLSQYLKGIDSLLRLSLSEV